MDPLLPDEFFEKLFSGDVRTVSRAISFVESDETRRRQLVERIFPKTGRATTIGITGSPGAGKSTLVDCLAKELSDRGFKVAVLAVDPSSPYTGGAILGDRIRMSQ
ncbi:UNVERIFIED_CONTAM: hypothetical protein GTU68_005866, partial [Idotea baltica]|nr:hypothetical protein [Idotea baltica]